MAGKKTSAKAQKKRSKKPTKKTTKAKFDFKKVLDLIPEGTVINVLGSEIELEWLAAAHTPMEEIAVLLKKPLDKLEADERFCRAYEQGKAAGAAILRVAMFKAAQRGDVRAQVWLAKNLLGQSDSPTPPPPKDESWVLQTNISNGSALVVPPGTDPRDAYEIAISGDSVSTRDQPKH